MYDDRQHVELFHGPSRYLFRGTLPSRASETPKMGPSVTPTSIDPIVATLFACRYRMEGPAIVLVALKSEFTEMLNGPNLACFHYELAVNLELSPFSFENRCVRRVSVDGSLAVLKNLGHQLPSRLPDLGALAMALTQSPRMRIEDIDRYVELCPALPDNR